MVPQKKYLTISENFYKQLLAIFDTKEMRNLITNSAIIHHIQQRIKLIFKYELISLILAQNIYNYVK